MTGAGAGGAAPAAQPGGAGGVPNLGDSSLQQGEARLDAKWLLAPLGLLLLVPLIVSAYYVRGWRRGRRAEALYGSRQGPLDLRLVAVVDLLVLRLERALLRPVREQETFRAGGLERLVGLVGGEVAA